MIKSEYIMKISFVYLTYSDDIRTRYRQRLQVDSRSWILLIQENDIIIFHK